MFRDVISKVSILSNPVPQTQNIDMSNSIQKAKKIALDIIKLVVFFPSLLLKQLARVISVIYSPLFNATASLAHRFYHKREASSYTDAQIGTEEDLVEKKAEETQKELPKLFSVSETQTDSDFSLKGKKEIECQTEEYKKVSSDAQTQTEEISIPPKAEKGADDALLRLVVEDQDELGETLVIPCDEEEILEIPREQLNPSTKPKQDSTPLQGFVDFFSSLSRRSQEKGKSPEREDFFPQEEPVEESEYPFPFLLKTQEEEVVEPKKVKKPRNKIRQNELRDLKEVTDRICANLPEKRHRKAPQRFS